MRWLRSILDILGAVLLASVLAFAAYDLFVFQPYRPKIEQLIERASSSEKSPPDSLQKTLKEAYGGRLSHQVVRLLLQELDASAADSQLGRHGTSILWWLLIEWHLSESQQMALFLSMSHLGQAERGFEHASAQFLDVPLAKVSVDQAATLVTLGKAPSHFLGNRDRLASVASDLAARVRKAASTSAN